jgi:hypothetical protein
VTVDGRVIGAGEAMCTRSERNWSRRDTFALRSMAQTRACSRALRTVLAFVMVLAGKETTPAEEMAADTAVSEPELPEWARPVDDVKPAAAALMTIFKFTDDVDVRESTLEVGRRIRERCGNEIPAIALEVLQHVAEIVEGDASP